MLFLYFTTIFDVFSSVQRIMLPTQTRVGFVSNPASTDMTRGTARAILITSQSTCCFILVQSWSESQKICNLPNFPPVFLIVFTPQNFTLFPFTCDPHYQLLNLALPLGTIIIRKSECHLTFQISFQNFTFSKI